MFALLALFSCATDPSPDLVAMDEEAGIKDAFTCDSLVSRASTWWSRRGCVVQGLATGSSLLPVSVGSTSYTTWGTLRPVLSARAVGPTGTRTNLAREIATARLNVAVFGYGDVAFSDFDGDGDVDSPNQILAAADMAYDASLNREMRQALTALTSFNATNNSGALWFDDTCTNDPEICDGLDNDGDGTVDDACGCNPDGPVYSFEADIQPILDANCIGCHSDYPEFGYYAPWGLDLNAGLSWGNLVNVAAGGLPSMDRVEPGDSADSYVIHKLRGTHLDVGGQGDRMPQYGPYLDDATIDMIAAWIDEGAYDN